MSVSREVLTVEKTLPNERLDAWLRSIFPTLSRGAIQRLIAQGEIRVNGRMVKPTHTPHAGERVEINWPEAKPATAEPEPIPLDILFEDEHLLVLNKAPDMVTHPSAGHAGHTLVNALLHHCEGQLSGIGGVARPGIVHRLDKDTSGCLVIAKHDSAHLGLAAQFALRQVRKVYQAIVCGTLSNDSGDIRASIARHPNHRKRMAVTDHRGREAWTTYRVIERLTEASLVEALLHTGRTHQIRVHFQHLGHPLIGDATYGSRQNQRLKELTGYVAPRQMLHACELGIRHPKSGETMTFTAPCPADFLEALVELRTASSIVLGSPLTGT